LSNNKFESIPESICKLTSLKNLDLYNNQLTSLPYFIGDLAQLEKIELRNIPLFKEKEIDIIVQGLPLSFIDILDNKKLTIISDLTKEQIKQIHKELIKIDAMRKYSKKPSGFDSLFNHYSYKRGGFKRQQTRIKNKEKQRKTKKVYKHNSNKIK